MYSPIMGTRPTKATAHHSITPILAWARGSLSKPKQAYLILRMLWESETIKALIYGSQKFTLDLSACFKSFRRPAAPRLLLLSSKVRTRTKASPKKRLTLV